MAKRPFSEGQDWPSAGDGGGGREQFEKGLKSIARLFLIIPLLIIVLIGIMSCFYTVQPEEQAVIKRFGKVVGEPQMPGLHFKLPFGIDKKYLVPTGRALKEEFGFQTLSGDANGRSQYGRSEEDVAVALMLTGDLNVIDVTWVVQYKIADPIKYLHSIRDPSQALRDVSEASMRQIVGNRFGSDVLTVGRSEISNDAKVSIQQIMDSYNSGIFIDSVELQDVVPPDRVQPAFNDVNVARQERERSINEAERNRNQIIPKMEGEASQVVDEAEGYASERVNRALGEANRFKAINAEYKNAPVVTRRRMFLEMIDSVLPRAGQVIVTNGSEKSNPLPILNLNTPTTQDLPAAASQEVAR